MDDGSAQAILLVIVLLLILAAVFVPVGGFYTYAFYQKSKRNRIRETVLRRSTTIDRRPSLVSSSLRFRDSIQSSLQDFSLGRRRDHRDCTGKCDVPGSNKLRHAGETAIRAR